MAVFKTIEIDGREVPFKASAAIPRIYRAQFRRDIFQDMDRLIGEVSQGDESASTLDIESLEIFENIAYIMAKYADPSVPDSVDGWLDEFNTFSIYQILPQIIDLWGLNVETDVEVKKDSAQPIDG